MCKQEFSDALRARLAGLTVSDVEERISFYCEMIDDRMEEGLSEEEATAAVGSVDEIAEQILSEIPLARIAKAKIKSGRRLRTREIVLLAAGSPIWLALGVTALAVGITLYACVWVLVACAWAIFGALAGGGLGGIAGGVIFLAQGYIGVGLSLVAAGLVLAGLAIFAYFGSLWTTKGAVLLTKRIVVGIKKCVIGKEKSK